MDLIKIFNVKELEEDSIEVLEKEEYIRFEAMSDFILDKLDVALYSANIKAMKVMVGNDAKNSKDVELPQLYSHLKEEIGNKCGLAVNVEEDSISILGRGVQITLFEVG